MPLWNSTLDFISQTSGLEYWKDFITIGLVGTKENI